MHASRKHGNSSTSDSLYNPHEFHSLQDRESCHQPKHFPPNDRSRGIKFPDQTSQDQYSTLESSSTTASYPVYGSPPSVSFSSNGSTISQQDSQSYPADPHLSSASNYGSPRSGSCVSSSGDDLSNKLKELENAMLGPDSDVVDNFECSLPASSSLDPDNWKQVMEIHRDLKEVLIACGRAVADNDLQTAECLMADLRQMVSVSGDPLQRLGAYMLEGLVARFASSGSSICKTLKCEVPATSDLLSYMHILYEICPYFKFGYMSANGAIAEALKDEDRIHIIDFQIAQGSQWISLIQALAARPGGPPHIRITGVDDPMSAYARGGGQHLVGQRLSQLAKSCKVSFEFNAAAMSGCEVQVENLAIRPGEALAVNFAFQLHHMPDESVSTQNHRDRLLRLVKGLSPKVVTLVEQECNTNTAPFFLRFVETLSYYYAVFESIDVALPRENKERISVEQQCLARDVVNIIACEGAERIERQELLGKWRSRFMMAGFTPYPLSSLVNHTIKTLLENYCDSYRLEERDGALYLGWMNRALVVSCAWI